MFKVGQKVVRFKGREEAARLYGAPFPRLNEVCTISNIYVDCDGDEQLELVEYPSPARQGWHAGYLARFFRPVVERKTDISVFTEMLTSKNKELVR